MPTLAAEPGITMVSFRERVYVQERTQCMPSDEVEEGNIVLNISSSELRRRLQQGLDIPDWFAYPEVIEELHRTHPTRHKQAFTVLFTGLSGSGKSTIANALLVRLLELGTRPVTLLDGDILRKNLSSGLGTVISMRSESALSLPKSPRTATSPSAPRSPRTRVRSTSSARTSAPVACSSKSMSRLRSRLVKSAFALCESRSAPAGVAQDAGALHTSWKSLLPQEAASATPKKGFPAVTMIFCRPSDKHRG